jgi:glycosyltransferase involved in cell wall biosynthesis
LRICFIVSEYFRWGKFGGYGTSTRLLASELSARGLEVTVLTPRRGDQPAEELVDGVQVIAYPAQNLRELARYCRRVNADIYHSHEPSIATVVARRTMPKAKHVVTCRDTRLAGDWLIEMVAWIRDGSFRTLLSFPYENNPWVFRAVRNADAVFCPNHFSRDLARKKFRLSTKPGFLPSPIRYPTEPPPKATRPTFCYVGRWDTRKRPELFLDLAVEFPHYDFIAIGQGRTPDYDRELRRRYGHLKNLHLPGFVDQFTDPRFADLLSSAWALINTALREGLPRSFMEAAAHGCAIMSRVDPDGFASRFGYRAKRDDFADGLRWLLEGNRWRPLGQAARDYVVGTYGVDAAIEAHTAMYQNIVAAEALAT